MIYLLKVGRDSSVGIVSRYGLDGPENEFQWGEIFRTRPNRQWGPRSFLYKGNRIIPRGKPAGTWR
jgi:hypothetical protein